MCYQTLKFTSRGGALSWDSGNLYDITTNMMDAAQSRQSGHLSVTGPLKNDDKHGSMSILNEPAFQPYLWSSVIDPQQPVAINLKLIHI